MPEPYLSTDPNAGEEYLSLDPNAGEAPRPARSLGGLLGNAWEEVKAAPGAAAEMVTGLLRAVPVLNAALRGDPGAITQATGVARAMPGAIASDLKQKYGGLNRIADTAYENPLSTLMDASVVLGGVGAAGQATRVPGLVRAGQAAARAGRAIDPVLGAARGAAVAGNVVRPSTATFQRWGTRWMQSAMKTAKTIEDSNTQNVAETAARLRIMPTEAGYAKNAAALDRLRAEANGIVREAHRRGISLDPEKVTAQLDREVRRITKGDPTPDAYARALEDVKAQFWENTSTPIKTPVQQTVNTGILDPSGQPVTRTQMVMQDTGQRAAQPLSPVRSLRFTERLNRRTPHNKGPMSMLGPESPADEANKALGQAIRAERERVIPGFNAVQAQRGERLAVQKQLRNYTLRREANLDPIPARALFGSGLTGGLLAAGAPASAAASGTAVPWIVNNPAFKGRTAIGLYHADKVLDKLGSKMRTGARAATIAETGEDLIRDALLQAMERTTEKP